MKQTRIENAVEQTVDYVGSFVYEDNVLKYILTGEGRVMVNSGGTYEYQYSPAKRHLQCRLKALLKLKCNNWVFR
jgi:hypothetical protein